MLHISGCATEINQPCNCKGGRSDEDTEANLKYFFFSFFTPRGPMNGLTKAPSKLEMIKGFIQNGISPAMIEQITKEDFIILNDTVAEVNAKARQSQLAIPPGMDISRINGKKN